MVSVNGEKITRAEFQTRLERLPVPNADPRLPPQQAGALVMTQLVNEKLILQLAKEKKVEPTEAQINKKIEMAKKEGDLAQMLQQRAMTLEDFKREMRVNQAYFNIMTKGIEVKEDEVRQVYEQALKADNSPFKRPEQVEIAMVMNRDKAKIDAAARMLKQGTDFTTVALRLSEHEPSKQRGGVVGWVSRNQQGVPKEFWERAFSLKPNAVSEPFQAPLGGGKPWFIIKWHGHRNAKVQSYDEVKDLLRERIALQKASRTTNFNKMLEDFRKKSKIVVKVERYKNVIKPSEEAKKGEKKD